jgi:DNA-binding transcriptional MerR regulator
MTKEEQTMTELNLNDIDWQDKPLDGSTVISMYEIVKAKYTHGNTEIAVLFPSSVQSNGKYQYDIDHPCVSQCYEDWMAVDINHNFNEITQNGNKVCVWHNHVNGTPFSSDDVFNLLVMDDMIFLVADTDDRLLVMYKTVTTDSLITQHSREYDGNKEICIRTKREEHDEKVVSTYADKLFELETLNSESYIKAFRSLMEDVREYGYREFRDMFGLGYFHIPKKNPTLPSYHIQGKYAPINFNLSEYSHYVRGVLCASDIGVLYRLSDGVHAFEIQLYREINLITKAVDTHVREYCALVYRKILAFRKFMHEGRTRINDIVSAYATKEGYAKEDIIERLKGQEEKVEKVRSLISKLPHIFEDLSKDWHKISDTQLTKLHTLFVDKCGILALNRPSLHTRGPFDYIERVEAVRLYRDNDGNDVILLFLALVRQYTDVDGEFVTSILAADADDSSLTALSATFDREVQEKFYRQFRQGIENERKERQKQLIEQEL